MTKIINTTQLQQKVGQIAKDIENNPYIIVNRGKARFVLLPYFEEGMEAVEDYFEDFLIRMNKEKLSKQFEESAASGESDLVV